MKEQECKTKDRRREFYDYHEQAHVDCQLIVTLTSNTLLSVTLFSIVSIPHIFYFMHKAAGGSLQAGEVLIIRQLLRLAACAGITTDRETFSTQSGL